MRLVSRVALSTLYAASCVTFAAACTGPAGPSLPNMGSAGTAASPSDAGTDAADAEPTPVLTFEPNVTLTLSPKATHVLKVVANPAGNFLVHFALIGSGSDNSPGDAALNTSEVITDDNGIAQVTLTAPSMPTTFNVRASVTNKLSFFLGVSVSPSHLTTLEVLPSYSGKRSVTAWVATVGVGSTCAGLVGSPPPDQALTATAAAGKLLTIVKVPVNVPLVVTLRAGHYVGGCTNQGPLSEVDGNQVLVYASDRPVNLDATQLNVSFGPSDPSPALSKVMNGAASVAEASLSSAGADDVTALLDAMHDATLATSRDAFDNARQTFSWDEALDAALGSAAATRLRDPADRWFSAGLTRFYAANAFAGQLSALPAGVLLSLATVAQVPAASAGFPTSFQGTWSAEANDTLLLGTQLSWVPSRLVTALAIAPALLEFPEATSVDSALALSLSCTLVGTTLIAHGSVPGSAYSGCDQNCAVSACAAAVSALWKNATNSSGSTSATLSVTAAGAAQVGDDASVTRLDGSWVGQLQIGADSAPASGSLSAETTAN